MDNVDGIYYNCEEDIMKYLKARWATLINCLWVSFLSTVVFLLDGVYPIDYMNWISIISIMGTMLPWCFVDYSNF